LPQTNLQRGLGTFQAFALEFGRKKKLTIFKYFVFLFYLISNNDPHRYRKESINPRKGGVGGGEGEKKVSLKSN
jgi:hypothetical protein